jgi:hypothetical protein
METPNENEEVSRDTNRRTLPATRTAILLPRDSSRKSFVFFFFPLQNLSGSIHLEQQQHHHHHQEQLKKNLCLAFDFY